MKRRNAAKKSTGRRRVVPAGSTTQSTKLYGQRLNGKSRITNGRELLPDVDLRSVWARRFRDLIRSYEADLGGDDMALSEAQRALARRAALIQTELEYQEMRLAHLREQGTTPAAWRLDRYARLATVLKKLIESLGINKGRIARDVTPPAKVYSNETERYVDEIRGSYGP